MYDPYNTISLHEKLFDLLELFEERYKLAKDKRKYIAQNKIDLAAAYRQQEIKAMERLPEKEILIELIDKIYEKNEKIIK